QTTAYCPARPTKTDANRKRRYHTSVPDDRLQFVGVPRLNRLTMHLFWPVRFQQYNWKICGLRSEEPGRHDNHTGWGRLKSRRAFSAVSTASSPRSTERSCATFSATSHTYDGSLRLPRLPCGARYGQSVSTSTRSAATSGAVAWMSVDFGKV